MKGQVVRVIAGFYDIESGENEYRVRGSGNLRNKGMSPVVGDIVEFTKNAFLEKIYSRNNFLMRPKVANVDQAIIIQSLKQPNYSSILLNKFLAIIENAGIRPVIVFTKTDLVSKTPTKEYIDNGYEVFEINNKSKKTLKSFSKIFKGKLSVFTGQTGAGKTTTINNLANVNLETQEISKALGRGKHTTRVVEIIPWLEGKLIDTPGFSSLEFEMTKLELSKSYHDFERESVNCKFDRNCLHDKENDCGIKDAVRIGKISKTRYNDYLRLLKEIE